MTWGPCGTNGYMVGYLDTLTDQKTGKTWVLRIGSDGCYYWQPIIAANPP